MSLNPNIRVFTTDQLRERDRMLVARANQATTEYVVREMTRMNSGQQVNAARHGAKSLYWSEKTLNRFLDNIDED
jgi:hypothetical protein